ncbi:MAG: SCO family protein [Novosphingobium sp.]
MVDIDPASEPQPGGSSRPLLFALALLVAIGGLAFGLTRTSGGAPGAASQSSIGGSFALIASDGSPFTEKNLAGKPFAIYFGYTRCPDVCPTSLARMARLRKQLGADGDKFAIVFVSVDPEHDKPAAIGEYVKLFGTPIIGVTGNDAQLKAIERSYGVYVNKVPQPGGDYLVDHSAAILLMDSSARLFDIIDHNEPDPSALAKLKRLIG